MNLRKRCFISLVVLLACQLGFAQNAAIRPDKTLAAKAIAAVQSTGKPVTVVPQSAVAGKPLARPTIMVGHALGVKKAVTPNEPSFCQTYWTYGYIFCPKGLTSAYQVSSIVGANQGKNIVIAIVDAYAYPGAQPDFNQFNTDMGLAGQTFVNVNLSPYDGTGSGWDLESNLDLQSAHAMAPKAQLVYIQAYDNSYDSLGQADDIAAKGCPASIYCAAYGINYVIPAADIVTNSWSGGENTAYDFYYTQNKVMLYSSGDGGSWPTQGFVGYPCSVPGVTCVGGTSLYVNSNLQRTSEVGWAGSGGGCSGAEAMPAYQGNNNSGQCYPYRASPDVAAVADPATGFSVYINNYYWGTGYYIVGGTSLASPVTAGLVANIDTARVSFGKSKLTFLNTSLYQAAASNYNYFLYDVTTGNNGYAAGYQFDLVTGLGNMTGKNVANRFFGLP